MARVCKLCSMVVVSEENLSMERRMALENISGLIIHNTKVIGKITSLKDMDNTFGPMAVSISVSGNQVK